MLPNPLHPAIVHFPVVIAILLPLGVIGALFAIRRGANTRRAWLLPMAAAIVLALSAWAAVQTGGSQSDRVQRVVLERAIEAHEEIAEAFFAGSVGVAVVALVGLAGGTIGRVARILTGAGALTLAGLVVVVGHSGGQLVYRDGAASAYTSQGTDTSIGAATREATRERIGGERPR